MGSREKFQVVAKGNLCPCTPALCDLGWIIPQAPISSPGGKMPRGDPVGTAGAY